MLTWRGVAPRLRNLCGEQSPAYSPDGRRIAFVRTIPSGDEEFGPREEVRIRGARGGRSRLVKKLPEWFELGDPLDPTTLSWQAR